MIRAMVVDDEVHAREELAALLRETGAVEVVALCADAVAAIPVIRSEEPDVLFLDVQMPAVSGFELLSLIDPDELPPVVFVTAHDAFAVKAFEANALDYLLKPVEPERLARTVERLQRGQARLPPAALVPAIRRIPCQGARTIRLIDLAGGRVGPVVRGRGLRGDGGRRALHRPDAAGARGAGRLPARPQAAPRQRGPGGRDPPRRRGGHVGADPLRPRRCR